MITRLLVLMLSLFLTGCSAYPNYEQTSGVSWSRFNPARWGSVNLNVTKNGVGELGADTPLTEEALRHALDERYLLRRNRMLIDGQMMIVYQVVRAGQVQMNIIGQQSGHIERIDILDPGIAKTSGVTLGTPFHKLYSSARGYCQQSSDNAGVECISLLTPHISYLFGGVWYRPAGFIPADDVLKNWQISKIIWREYAR